MPEAETKGARVPIEEEPVQAAVRRRRPAGKAKGKAHKATKHKNVNKKQRTRPHKNQQKSW